MSVQQREIHLLVSALLDDAIDERQFVRLDELLATDAEARASYVRLMHLHAELPDLVALRAGEALRGREDHAGEDEALHPAAWVGLFARSGSGRSWRGALRHFGERTWQAARRPTPISLGTSALVLGLIITVMAYVGVPAYRNPTGEGAGEIPPLVVASFTRFCDAQWPQEYPSGPPLHLVAGKRVELRGGFAEVTFRDGSRVVLQGPAVFDALSRSSGMLRRGRLTAIIPQGAVGFSVTSPCLKLVDLGTEFGMHVDESGSTDVCVFDGRVELVQQSPNAQPTGRMILSAGGAARVTPQTNEFLEVEPSAEDFVRPEDFDELVVRQNRERWRDFAATLAGERDLLAYYSFDQPGQSPEKLLNKATRQRGAIDGRIDGADWTVGRWQEKSALQFGQPGDCVHLDFGNTPFQELTVATWLNVAELRHELNAVIYANDWEQQGAAHFTILKDGRIEFAVRGNTPEAQPSDAASMQRRLGRWVHVAVVYNARGKTVRFYINGIRSGSREFTQAGPAHFRQAQLGNWKQQERNMIGKMDELIVYQRALTDEEVLRIFTAGRP